MTKRPSIRSILMVLGIVLIVLGASSCVCTPDPVVSQVVTPPPVTPTTLAPATTTTTLAPVTTTTVAPTTTTTLFLLPSIVVAEPSPKRFSPDGDGKDEVVSFILSETTPEKIASWTLTVMEPAVSDVAAVAAPKIFRQWSGKGTPPASIEWNGISTAGEKVESGHKYPYRFDVIYNDGEKVKSEGYLFVDLLMIKEGTGYRFRLATLIFRPDSSDFNGLTTASTDQNEMSFDRVVELLRLYSEYQVIIEGHANNEGKITGASADKIAAEEKNEVVPLSLARATSVRDKLIAKGIAASRLSVVGKGSSEPIVSFQDAVNRWKNRRVEFILVK